MVKLFYKLLLIFVFTLSAILLYQKNIYAYHTLVHIDPIPHTKTLIAQKKYVDAAEYLDYFMTFSYMKENNEAKALQKAIAKKRNSLSYLSKKIVEGFSTGTSDEVLGQASAIGSDFLLIGDLRDLALEGTHYYKHEEVDEVLVALSTVGLVASASALFTLGSSAVAKSGVSVLKLAQKSKSIPTWLSTYLVREAKQIRKTKNLSNIKPLFNILGTLQKEVGLKNTLKLLSKTQNFKELKGMTNLAKRYGKKTSTLLTLSNKKVLTHAKQLSKVDAKTIALASTYGTSGFVHLIKGGEKNFIKTTKRLKAYAKVGYKGELWKVFLWFMKHLSDAMLMVIMGITSLLLFPWRKLLKFILQ